MRPVTYLLPFLLLLNFAASAQSLTPNIGFENGSFANWQLYSGSIDVNGNISVMETSPGYGDVFTLYGKESAQILDDFGKFPVLCPNGSKYSVKLNDTTSQHKAQRITYTFQAPSSGQYSIIFNYAVVLENPSHQQYQQPAFTARVFDVTDNVYINCPSFDFIANAALPGFQLSNAPGAKDASIYYKPWSTATIDLIHYLGKTIRLEFTVNDCTLGGHFGYAYLDVQDSDGNSAITGNAYCLQQTESVTLVGPTGFSSYNWYAADLKTQLGEGQSLTISPAPADKTNYALVVEPFLGLGCTDTLYTTVDKINSNFIFKVPDTAYACIGSVFDLTGPAVVQGSDAGLTYSYYSDPLATVYAYNPNLLTKSGQYYIKAINSYGCSGVLPVYVKFELPSLKVTTPATVQYPTPVDLTTTFTHQPGITYAYYTDTTSNRQVPNPTTIHFSGTYYVQVLDTHGCYRWYPINVTVEPPPPFILSAPNTFTPNNDGINDFFGFKIEGYLSYNNVKIFNRNGQLIFTMKNVADTWDGNFSGRQLPDGVYYWVFEGTDTYYNTKVTRSGSITIIR